MSVLGACIFVVGLPNSAMGFVLGGAYLTYGIAGAVWIMLFLCPFCHYWNTMACPCGYGRIAARLRQKRGGDRFCEKFRTHIPVIMPLWFIPIVGGMYLVFKDFSWPLLVLLIVFAVDAFVILPLFSAEHGCADCPQRDSCPWMVAIKALRATFKLHS